MIAALYLRKSNAQEGRDEEDKSVARQEESARRYAKEKGWTVNDEHVYKDDGVSGALFDESRPGLMQLLNALKPRPAFDVLVMMDSTRLGRDQIPTMWTMQRITDAGVRVFFYDDGTEAKLDSPIGQMMQSLQAFGAAMQREMTRRQTRDAMLRKARSGYVTGGSCFGYDSFDVMSGTLDRSGRPKRAHVERRINTEQAAIVRRIFELTARGHGKHQVAKLLNAEHAPAPRPQQGRPLGWCASSVRAVLYRETYRGVVVWNRTITRSVSKFDRSVGRITRKDRQVRQPATEWIRVDVPQLRIVDEDLWHAAHARLAKTRDLYLCQTHGQLWGRPLQGVEAKYLLAGLVRCAKCGAALEARTSGTGSTRGRGRKFFYMCSAHRRKGATVCPGVSFPMEPTNAAVLDALRTRLLRSDILHRALDRVLARATDTSAVARREQLTRRRGELQLELQRLMTLAIAGDGSELKTVRDGIQLREDELARLERDLARAVDAPKTDRRAAADALSQLVTDWQDTLDAHPAKARQMVRKLLRTPILASADAKTYHLKATTSIEPLISVVVKTASGVGVTADDLTGFLDAHTEASPTGFEPVFWP